MNFEFVSYVAFQQLSHRHTLVTALNDMVPVRARRQIEYSKEILKENAPSERVLKKQEPYALSHINRKLVLEPKVGSRISIIMKFILYSFSSNQTCHVHMIAQRLS